MENLHRFFALSALFESYKNPIPLQTILDKLECSNSTFKRFIANLRNYGYPIQFSRKSNGYYLDDDSSIQIPGLWFGDNELQALLIIQQLLQKIQPTFLGKHFQKIETYTNNLLESTEKDAKKISDFVQIIPVAHQHIEPDIFMILSKAIFHSKQIYICYQDIKGNLSRRNISIQRLVYYRDHWYLDAWCHTRKSIRTFWVAGIQSIEIKDEVSLQLSEESLAELGNGYGIFAGKDTDTAHLRFKGLAAMRVRGSKWHPDQKQVTNDDGTVELWIPYSDHREIIMDIMRYGHEVTVISPVALKNEIINRLVCTLNIYEEKNNLRSSLGELACQ